MATKYQRHQTFGREAAHTAMCMFEAWLDFSDAGRQQWYPNMCRFREENGIAALRLFLMDLAAALEEHAGRKIAEVDGSCWDWDVIPLFLKFIDETYRGDAPASEWSVAENDIAAALRRTVEHLQESPILPR